MIFERDSKAVMAAVSGWRDAGLTVRVVRGRKMRTVEQLFDEVAAALQFPDYFGENWAAFDECLADMDWLPVNNGVAIAVLQPAEVLADAPDVELAVLVSVITHAAETYAEPISSGEWWDRPEVPFHVVLHACPGESDDVIRRWSAAGATVVPFK